MHGEQEACPRTAAWLILLKNGDGRVTPGSAAAMCAQAFGPLLRTYRGLQRRRRSSASWKSRVVRGLRGLVTLREPCGLDPKGFGFWCWALGWPWALGDAHGPHFGRWVGCGRWVLQGDDDEVSGRDTSRGAS